MSREITFFIDGRLYVIERFEDETDPSFAERSSFILKFRKTQAKYKMAQTLSYHHVAKMFKGVTYNEQIEALIKQFRELEA